MKESRQAFCTRTLGLALVLAGLTGTAAAPTEWIPKIALMGHLNTASATPVHTQNQVEEKPMVPFVETVGSELDGGTGGVSVGADGTVYVADFGSVLGDAESMGRQIFSVEPSGSHRVFAVGFEGGSGNEFDSRGYLYQSNIRGHFVSRISPDGTHSVFARNTLSAPVGIAINAKDELFVANCGNGSISRVSRSGEASVFATSPLLNCPNGVTFDDSGQLYVANFSNGDVLKVDPQGTVSRVVTVPGNNNGHLTFHDGALYVVARSDHRIYRVLLGGEIQVFAGTGIRGHSDGPLLEAQFSLPNDMKVGADGKSLYVNEIAPTDGDPNLLTPMRLRRIVLEPPDER